MNISYSLKSRGYSKQVNGKHFGVFSAPNILKLKASNNIPIGNRYKAVLFLPIELMLQGRPDLHPEKGAGSNKIGI